jgi:O-antigen/teichoic acid export membrane protein
VPFLLLINFTRNILKWTFDRKKFLIVSIGPCFLQVCLLYCCVKFYSTDLKDLLKVTLLSNILFGLLGLCLISKWLAIPKGFKRLREMIPFAIPIGIISIAGLFLPALERSLVNNFLGSESLGDYAVATKIALVVGLVINAFQTAWGPFSLSIYKQTNAIETYNTVLKIFSISICIATLVITIIAGPLVSIFASNQYNGAEFLVFPLVMGLSIQGISWVTELGIGISKKTYLNFYSYLGNIVVTMTGIVIGIPIFGLLGVGLAVMFGFTAKALIASYLAQKVYPMHWHYGKIVTLISSTMGIGILAVWLQYNFSYAVSISVLLIGIVITLFVGWFVIFNFDEKRNILLILRRKSFKF